MRHRVALLSLLLLLGAVAFVAAQTITPIPELCGDGLDNDANDTVDNGCPQATHFTASGADYVTEAEDCVLLAPAAALVDALASGGDAVTQPSNTAFGTGYLKCTFNVAEATYFLRIKAKTSTPKRTLFVDTAPFGRGNPFSQAKASLLFAGALQLSYDWDFVNRLGTGVAFLGNTPAVDPQTFALNGTGAFYVALTPGVVLDTLCLSTTQTAACATGSQIPEASYAVVELGANTITIDGILESVWDTANLVSFNGHNSGTTAGCCCRMIWDNAATDRLYVGCTITDTQLESTATATDAGGVLTDDGIWLAWKDGFDADLDATTFDVAANISSTQAHLDRNYSGGAATTSYSATVTKARTTIGTLNTATDTDGSFTIELVADLGFDATPGDIIRLELRLNDKDGGAYASRDAFGVAVNGIANPVNWGYVELSSTELPGTADTTAPTVNNTAESNITQTTATLTADTNEAGGCFAEYDTNTGTPYASRVPTSGTVASSGGKCTINVTGLTANTGYFWRMRVTDGAGNTGNSAENTFTTAPAVACTHYAAHPGSGTACTTGAPCSIATAWTLMAPGETLCLKDGSNYIGASSMIQPPTTLSGTAALPITVKAENDGAVTINGQCVRRPVDITGDYFILEGINAHSAQDSVIRIQAASFGGQVKRVVAWDAGCDHSGNEGTTFAISGDSWLVEDSAAFGIARKHFDSAQGGNDNTFRRVFCRWEQRPGGSVGPSTCMSLFYNHFRMTLENAIFNRDAIDTNQATQSQSTFGQDGVITGSDRADSRLLGSIGYIRNDDINCCGHVFSGSPSATYEIKDSVFYIEPGGTAHTTKKAINVANSGNPPRVLSLTNIVGVSATASTISSDWIQSNVRTGTSLTNAIGAGTSVFNEIQGICKRYVNGTLTTTNLWPWPMNARIIAAMTAAGKTPIDVTAEIEELLGPIPAGCGG